MPDRASGTAWRRALWAIIGAGVLIRLALALTTDGVRYDIQSFNLVGLALHNHGLDAYSVVNSDRFPRWPYPPGFFPWILVAQKLSTLTGAAFAVFQRLPFIAADAAIAWLVQAHLGREGAQPRTRLVAAALVALGPSFIAVSGFHGQMDSLAILPAVAAVMLWQRPGLRDRALWAGALVGLGGAIKTVPLLLMLALLPTVQNRREGLRLVASALGVFLVAMLPFLLADPKGVEIVARYRGAVGLGSLSLVAQPDLPLGWFSVGAPSLTGVSHWLSDHGGAISGVALVAIGAFLARVRVSAVVGAVLVWLTVYVFGVSFFLQYIVWGLPFMLLAGRWRAVLALEAVLLVPTLITYLKPSAAWQVWVGYTAPMVVVWLAMLVALVLVARANAARPAPRRA